jgi:hypothetical protein
MNTSEIKKRLIKPISEVNDEELLKGIYHIVENKLKEELQEEIMHSFNPEEVMRIKKAMKELDEGKGIPHRVVMDRLKKLR